MDSHDSPEPSTMPRIVYRARRYRWYITMVQYQVWGLEDSTQQLYAR